MSGRTDNLTSILTPFGLTDEEAGIYLVLLENGVMTALAISRKLGMGRTKVYRLLDKLIKTGLVANQFNEIGFKFVAEPPEKLAILVNLQKAKVEGLEKSLPEISQALLSRMGGQAQGTKVRFYQGKEGLTRVNLNMTRAKGELLSYELETANAFMDYEEAEEMRRELVKNEIRIRTLTNAIKIEAFTDVAQLVTNWEVKQIPEEVLEIQLEMFLYNDICCVYNYVGQDVFAVEMENPKFTKMQKQFFKILWEVAEPLAMIGTRGEARVEK